MVARRRGIPHEEHVNHEAWAIPYADLLTLLLAFFVVMYALSSMNEGKYKILATSLASAFGGPPRSVTPIQLGKSQVRGSDNDRPSAVSPGAPASPAMSATLIRMLDKPTFQVMTSVPGMPTRRNANFSEQASRAEARSQAQLQRLSDRIRHALDEMVREKLVRVRYNAAFIEVEIQSDILFASGVATPSPLAISTIGRVSAVLKDEPNAIRVEGYTDNVPIATARYPSNWELSSARASSVVHELIGNGVEAGRLAVIGFGEYQPTADNTTAEGRNANRRVILVIMAQAYGADTFTPDEPGDLTADATPADARTRATIDLVDAAASGRAPEA